MVLNRPGVKREENVTFGNFTDVDDFDADTLGLQWMTLRTPAADLYSLTSNPGYLTINCADINSSEKVAIPYIGRRVQHHKYEAATRLIFNAGNENQCAGLLVFKDENHQFLLARGRDAKGGCVLLHKIDGKEGEELAKEQLNDSISVLDLKVVSQGKTLDFYYSTDNGAKWQTLATGIDAQYTSTANAGGFTGTTVGPYATNKK